MKTKVPLITISGQVSGLKEEGGGIYTVRFRIDNRPVVCYMKANIVNGDILKVIIPDEPEPTVVALRNESTKLYYGPPEVKPKFSVGGLIFGILTIPLIGVGFFIIWMTIDGYRGQFGLRDYAREIKRMMGS